MSERINTPIIDVLSSFTPKEIEGVLHSPQLSTFIEEYSPFESVMWADFSATNPGELEELSFATQLASFYQLKTAEKLQNNPENELLWVQRFNLASQELNGSIDPHEVTKIVAKELSVLEAGDPDSTVTKVYRHLLGGAKAESAEVGSSDLLGVVREALMTRFSSIAEVISTLPEGPYDSATVRDVFQKILSGMAEKDSDWSEWEITNTEGKTMLSVLSPKKKIDIPDGRGPVESKSQLMGLAFHEIGVHALRAVNGYKTEDGLMAKGYPGYIDFEEGLGILFEFLATGIVPDKTLDRYVDIALATGAVNGYTLSRAELIELGVNREFVRAKARDQNAPDAVKIRGGIVAHVNRIFRGGTGQPILDQHTSIISQPVFTKDLVYYEGLAKARDFVETQIATGTSADALLDFLLSGKFDATNLDHVAYLASRHSVSIQ